VWFLNKVQVFKEQIPLRLWLEDEAQFDNFYAGAKNKELLAYLQSNEPDLLYLYGSTSVGVSHLLIAISKRAEASGRTAQYVPLKELLDAAPAEILRQLNQLDLLCLDDLDLVADSESWQVEILHLFNRLREQGTHFVFGGHSAPTELQIGLADLRSRVLSGQTWALTELEDADKLLALKHRSALRGFNLADNVARYLLGHQQRDMSHLMNLLDRLDRLSLEEKKLITLPLVKQLIESS
jgi:DnaA-homolog protein